MPRNEKRIGLSDWVYKAVLNLREGADHRKLDCRRNEVTVLNQYTSIFGLRTFLLATNVVAIAFGVIVWKVR
jgi:hypothetical protein